MRATTKIIPSRAANLGILELNHPKALHALTMDMIECMQDVLGEWGEDSSLKAILIKASEAKRPAFCAGGDVKAVYEKGLANDNQADFFFQEYQVNHALGTSKRPIVSLWDGVVMGGGVGISIHGRYRVATENSLFAMPETAIGLFPDVGSLFWMPRMLDRPISNYLGLTGNRAYPADLMYSGLATHYVPSEKLPALESALIDATETSQADDVLVDVLSDFCEGDSVATDDCFLAQNRSAIDNAFNGESVEEIMEALKAADDDFSAKTLATMNKMSPTAMKISLEGLKRGLECETFAEDLKMEYRMARACTLPGGDFYEGVRCMLIDRKDTPQWNPPTVEEVTAERVEEFFAPIENEWWTPESKL